VDQVEETMSDQWQVRPGDSGPDSAPARNPARERAKELTAARRRATVAKGVFGVTATLVFGAAALFARHSYPGHPKNQAVPLGAPRNFTDVVRRNLLQAGEVAPQQAPPNASTSVS
jgi:hypothetical protein